MPEVARFHLVAIFDLTVVANNLGWRKAPNHKKWLFLDVNILDAKKVNFRKKFCGKKLGLKIAHQRWRFQKNADFRLESLTAMHTGVHKNRGNV